jgi:hypothetical protein
VGQPRYGMVDVDYRKLIRARIAANRSKKKSRYELRVELSRIATQEAA